MSIDWAGDGLPVLSQVTAQASVHSSIAEVARGCPDAIAIVEGDARLSYRALRERIERLMVVLQSRGVRRGDVVGLLAERSADAIAAMLAILELGAAFLPIDPAYPRKRIDLLLDRHADEHFVQLLGAASFHLHTVKCLLLRHHQPPPAANG